MTPSPVPTTAYLLLGANLGADRTHTLAEAIKRLPATAADAVMAVSALYESTPWGGMAVSGQAPYLNQAVALRTLLDPFALLHHCHAVEAALGRDRAAETTRYAPRTLDVDILLFGGFQIEFFDELILPHPRLQERRFALAPLHDIAPALVVPGAGGRTVAELLNACLDDGVVRRLNG